MNERLSTADNVGIIGWNNVTVKMGAYMYVRMSWESMDTVTAVTVPLAMP